MIQTVLFDFDQTLVDSRALAPMRAIGFWPAVAAGIPQLQLYPGIPEVLSYLRSQGIRIGVVSNSPKENYLVPACAHLSIQPDVIIGYHEVTRRKPYPEPYIAAMAALRGVTFPSPEAQTAHFATTSPYYALKALGVYSDTILAVGDWSNDIAAAYPLYVSSVAALWGASEPDELFLAHPNYVCEKAEELIPLIEDLKFRKWKVPRGDAWANRATKGYADRIKSWTRLDTTETGDRPFLRNDEEVYHLRRRHKGNWGVSVTNSHISAFKTEKPTEQQLGFKKQAAELFATELAAFMERDAAFLFVPTSKKRDHPDFDNRNDFVVWKLSSLRPDLGYFEPVTLIASKEKASESDDQELRDPAVIMANYQWKPHDLSNHSLVYVIDDVLTKGGHIKATEQFVRTNVPAGVRVVSLAWALHFSD